MQTLDQEPSLLTPIGYRNNSCGYCHNKSGSFSYYLSAKTLTAKFYQSLLDRGFRRSGTLIYKPDLFESCCPQYTIRLDSHAFHASKDQRQCLNRFNKHVLGEQYVKEAARLFPLSRDQARRRNTDFQLVDRIHESERTVIKTPPEPAHELSITLELDDYTEEKYLLFENYQRNVHKEPPSRISKSGFKNFLCNSPLTKSTVTTDGHERRLGSYHQCYRLDGKLVAIGVLDLLPQCVSAVYFMYDETVHQHGFGKLGALREIALAREEGYRFWYAGFYIHSCVKMRYKGDYSPQYILDPESYEWEILNDDLKRKLDVRKYISPSRERSGAASDVASSGGEAPDPSAMKPSSEGGGDDLDSDSDDEPPIPQPDLILFARTMPGILSREDLLTKINLDHIKLRVRGMDAEACDLVSWQGSDLDDPESIKGIIAELVAAVGVELGKKMIVAFS